MNKPKFIIIFMMTLILIVAIFTVAYNNYYSIPLSNEREVKICVKNIIKEKYPKYKVECLKIISNSENYWEVVAYDHILDEYDDNVAITGGYVWVAVDANGRIVKMDITE